MKIRTGAPLPMLTIGKRAVSQAIRVGGSWEEGRSELVAADFSPRD